MDYATKLSIAFRGVKNMFTENTLAGSLSDTRGLLEGDLLHHLRKITRLTEEDAIDFADQLNIRDVLIVKASGEFFFNENFADVTVLE